MPAVDGFVAPCKLTAVSNGSWERVAAARLRSLARVVRSVSHAAAGVENTLALYLSLLGTSGAPPPDDAKRQRYLDTMDSQRRRLSTLFNAVFAYLPSHEGSDVDLDLEATVRHAVVLAGTLGNDRSVSLQTEGAAALGKPLRIARECVRQAILDGLLLAVERTPAGGTVATSLAATGTNARLDIRTPGGADPVAGGCDTAFADCQADLRAAGGDARCDVADGLHIQLDLPCSPAELL